MPRGRVARDCRRFCLKSHTLPDGARKMYGEERHENLSTVPAAVARPYGAERGLAVWVER